MKKLPILMAAATLAAACLAVSSSAEARTRYGIHNVYAYGAWYAPRHGYAARYYGRFNSNLNPDRQMVGIGE